MLTGERIEARAIIAICREALPGDIETAFERLDDSEREEVLRPVRTRLQEVRPVLELEVVLADVAERAQAEEPVGARVDAPDRERDHAPIDGRDRRASVWIERDGNA